MPHNDLLIKELTQDELEEAQMMHDTTSPWYPITKCSWTAYINESRYKLIGIYELAQLCGILILLTVNDEADIIFIEVSKKHRRKGYGSTLINWSLTKYALRKIFLEVRSTDMVAIMFYKNVGFITEGQRIGYYAACDGITMSYTARQ